MIWAGIALCLLVSFVFSGIEAGILSVNRVRLRHRLKLGDAAAITLDRLLANPERLLVTVLVVTNFMNILAIALTTQELVRAFGKAGYLATGILFLPIYLLGLELLPKSLFRRFPYRALAALVTPLKLADLLLAPMHLAGSALSKLLLGRRPADQRKLFVGREDFKYLTIESERVGTLGKAERQMIHSVVDFRAVVAREVMIPLRDVRTLSEDASVEELIARSHEQDIERWPLLSPTGEITGVVTLFDVALDVRRHAAVGPYHRRIVKVLADEPAFNILRKLRAARITLASVVESDGHAVGIVTWEDLIRRLVTPSAA